MVPGFFGSEKPGGVLHQLATSNILTVSPNRIKFSRVVFKLSSTNSTYFSNLLWASCNLLWASCNLLWASSNLLWASCNLLWASCNLLWASCSLLWAFCSTNTFKYERYEKSRYKRIISKIFQKINFTNMFILSKFFYKNGSKTTH